MNGFLGDPCESDEVNLNIGKTELIVKITTQFEKKYNSPQIAPH